MSTLTLEQANTMVAVAVREARKAGYRPMTVVVLDDAGHLKVAQREDGASMFRLDIAIGKAWAAVAMGTSSRTLLGYAKEHSQFFTALSATSQGKFVPQTGAVLIRDASGAALGAMGASGGTGDEDELICKAGVDAAGLVAA